jgi:hypothetical protein
MRPRRIYTDGKNRFFYISKGVKKYIRQIPNITNKQLTKVNLNNIIHVEKPRRIRRRKKNKKKNFIFTNTFSTNLIPIPHTNLYYPIQQQPNHNTAPIQPPIKLDTSFDVKIPNKIRKKLDFDDELSPISHAVDTPEKTKIENMNYLEFDKYLSSILSETPERFRQKSEEKIIEHQIADLEHRNASDTSEKEPEIQGGGGSEGLYDYQIEEIAQKSIHHVIPVITNSNKDIESLINFVKPNQRFFACVINVNNHWVCCIIDNRDDFPSIEYYDSLCEFKPSRFLLKELSKISEKMDPEVMFKFKINRIVQQRDKTDCGYHCLNFITNRYEGMSFPDASGYTDYINRVSKGEKLDNSKEAEHKLRIFVKKYKSFL